MILCHSAAKKCKTTIWSFSAASTIFSQIWDAKHLFFHWFSIAIDVWDTNWRIQPFGSTTGTSWTKNPIVSGSGWRLCPRTVVIREKRKVKTKNFVMENLKEGKMSTLSLWRIQKRFTVKILISRYSKIFQMDLLGWGWMMMKMMKNKILIDINCNIDRPDRPCGCMSTYFLLPL